MISTDGARAWWTEVFACLARFGFFVNVGPQAEDDDLSLPLILAPLKHRQFAWLCAGTMISALGTWIQSTTSAWIMTSLAPDALMVSLTQAAQLPILFLVVPAGALADLVDRRRYLVLTNVWMLAVAVLLAVLYGLGLVGPWLLLALTALLSVGVALNAPAWSSSFPLTVPRDDLPPAVLLNSMGFNLARAIGPALGGNSGSHCRSGVRLRTQCCELCTGRCDQWGYSCFSCG